MQELTITILENKKMTYPSNIVLVEGENLTTQVTVSAPSWVGLSIGCLITTPAGVMVDEFSADAPFKLTNAMLDRRGYIRLEFVGYKITEDSKEEVLRTSHAVELPVRSARPRLGEISPEPLPDLIAETTLAKQTALTAARQADEAAASAAEIDAQARAAEAVREAYYEGFNARLAEKLSEEPNHYFVGANQKYKTIGAAVAAWTAAGKPASIIHISSGIYTEKINLQGIYSSLSFIGEDKTHVIWKQTTGYYPDCPLTVSGDCVIRNITFVADHTSTPEYIYTAYSTGNTGGAYALHVDAPNAPGLVLIENCDLISYQNAGLGCGTCKNRELRLENCNLYNYSDFESKSNGALLYHADSANDSTGQKFVMHNCNLYNKSYYLVLFINNIGNTVVDAEFINNTLWSGAFTTNADLTLQFDLITDFDVMPESHGNNALLLNGSRAPSQNSANPTFTGTVTLPSTTSIGNVDGTEIGYLNGVTANIQDQLYLKKTKLLIMYLITVDAVLTTGYANGGISVNTSSAVVLTIPNNATSAWPIGSILPVYRRGSGSVTISPATGVSVESSGGLLSIRARYEMVELIKIGTDAWILHGSLA